jgi:hypothetical protein
MKQPWQHNQDMMRQQREQQERLRRQQMQDQMLRQQQDQTRRSRRWEEDRQWQEDAARRAATRRQAHEQRARSDDPFARVEVEAARLQEAYAAGRLTEAELQARLGQLRVQDETGVWWTVDLDTLGWVRHDGTVWVPDTPPKDTQWTAPAVERAYSASGRRPVPFLLLLVLAAAATVVAIVFRSIDIPFKTSKLPSVNPQVTAAPPRAEVWPFTRAGRVDSIQGQIWTVEGQAILVPFPVTGQPAAGVQTIIDGVIQEDGVWKATKLRWEPSGL